jgi:hypothetical protein
MEKNKYYVNTAKEKDKTMLSREGHSEVRF